jgi:hypothetical protein
MLVESRRNEMRSANDKKINRWIQEHEREMICCPHQPGLLLISKKSCLKRYRAALARVFENVSQENPFHFTLKKGLILCEGCPIGRKFDEEASESGERQKKRAISV